MNVSVSADIKGLIKTLNTVQKTQIPSALSQGLNSTVFEAQKALKDSLPRYIDHPTAHTIRGVQVKKSTKRNLEAFVGFRSTTFGKGSGTLQSDYMKFQVLGGTRRPSKSALAVPFPKHQKLNKFGNLRKGKIAQLLSDKDRYFSGVPKGQADGDSGIWERMPRNSKRRRKWTKASGKQIAQKGGKIRMLVGWEPKATYQKRLPMQDIVRRTVNRTFKRKFETALSRAMASAK